MSPDAFDAWLTTPPPARPALVMGILNLTPDSFSDGGQFGSIDAALAHVDAMAVAGADLIDVGGESTRPGSLPVSDEDQIARVLPLFRALRGRESERSTPVTLSIDTTRAAVAEAALDAGAHIINDISAGRDDPGMLPLAAARAAPIVLMHMQGTPATMQRDPQYADVAREVAAFLLARAAAAQSAGIPPARILLDPGIGFGKNQAHNLELLRRMGELTALGYPLLVGTSRKGFIGRITGESEPAGRVFGTAASVAWSLAQGAAIVRVHDVKPMAQVARMIRAIQNMGNSPVGARPG